MSSLYASVSLIRRYQGDNKIDVTVVDLLKSQSARAARARATFVDAPSARPPPVALSAARSCTRAVGNAGVSVRNGVSAFGSPCLLARSSCLTRAVPEVSGLA